MSAQLNRPVRRWLAEPRPRQDCALGAVVLSAELIYSIGQTVQN
jgi:hypothetical protein